MIITNDRLKRPNFPGDTKTPEQKIPNLSELDGKFWETCMTMNGTWGWRTSDNNWKSTKTLIHNLCDIASKGGNYLLNVGPKPDGTFPQQSVDRLKEIGEWMKVNGEAIYGTKASPIESLAWGRVTKKESKNGTILYFSVFDWPADGKLFIPNLKNKVVSAQLLGGGEIKLKSENDGIEIKGPEKAPNQYASVIKVEFKGNIEPAKLAAKEKMKTGELD
jgi:alpha-L-fucosidase